MRTKNDFRDDKREIVKVIETLIDENRVMNFSDAVFAFAATLLVLKLELPAIDPAAIGVELPNAVMSLWPSYFANIISFLIIGYYWLNHHAIFGMITKFDKNVVWINIVFLIALSFLPFPVDLFGDYSSVPVVIMFYSLSLSVVGFLLASIWIYATYKRRLVPKSLSDRHIEYYTLRNLLAPIVFALAVPIALVDPLLAQFSWAFVILGLIVINKFFAYKRISEVEKLSV